MSRITTNLKAEPNDTYKYTVKHPLKRKAEDLEPWQIEMVDAIVRVTNKELHLLNVISLHLHWIFEELGVDPLSVDLDPIVKDAANNLLDNLNKKAKAEQDGRTLKPKGFKR